MTYPDFLFIGGKKPIWNWVNNNLINLDLNYKSVLDVFGGTGFVSYQFLIQGSEVIYNDILQSNCRMVNGLLKNPGEIISPNKIFFLLNNNPEAPNNLMAKYYSDYYLLDEIPVFDKIIDNLIELDASQYIKDAIFYALAQTLLIKRPMINFEKSNIQLRLKESKIRQSWDIGIDIAFKKNIEIANTFISNKKIDPEKLKIFNETAIELDKTADLVYLDPPFVANKKQSRRFANYVKQYHLLEILANPNENCKWIDLNDRWNRIKEDFPAQISNNEWKDPEKALQSFDNLFKKFKDKIIVLSYRNDSYISINELNDIMSIYFDQIEIIEKAHEYLNKSKKASFNDILVVAKN